MLMLLYGSQNTYSTAVTIGEKAASIIAEELGLGVEMAIRARL